MKTHRKNYILSSVALVFILSLTVFSPFARRVQTVKKFDHSENRKDYILNVGGIDEDTFSFSDAQDDVKNGEELNFENNYDGNSDIEFLLIAVMTSRENFQKRADIRNTWGKGHHNVLFFVGSSDCELPKRFRAEKWDCVKKANAIVPEAEAEEKRAKYASVEAKLLEELDEHGDIVFLNMMESYRKLPQKLKLIYSWALGNLDVQWILKVDDDMFVWVDKLESFLRDKYSSSRMTILGTIARNWRVHRKGKWAETLYEKPRYPRFAIGQSGHLVSRDVAQRIVQYNGTDHQGEDVSIGIWIKEMEAQNKHLKFNLVNSPVLSADGDCSVKGGHYVIGHKLGHADFVKCLNG